MGEVPDEPDLTGVQHRLQHAILTPGPPAESASAMFAGTAELSAAQRLEIYRNGCRRRRLEAMEHLHPALRSLLGDDLFDDFASEYLEANPSRTYTLEQLDASFADHLSSNRPDADGPQAWIDILIDLARYERVFAEVYDGPGIEREPEPPDVVPSASVSTGARRVIMDPSVRSLRVSAAVHEYHAAVRGGTTPPPLVPRPTCLALWRRDYRVRVATLTRPAHDLLEALLAGGAFSEACADAALDPDAASEHLRAWTARGWVRTHIEPARIEPARIEPARIERTRIERTRIRATRIQATRVERTRFESPSPRTPSEPAVSSTPPAPQESTQ
ncbi:DNA-binding domain-containing protein [Spirillospora sp. NPDC052269]